MKHALIYLAILFLLPCLILFVVAQQPDQLDLLRLLNSWHVDAGGDLNGDGLTDKQDLLLLSQQWKSGVELSFPTPTPEPVPIVLTAIEKISPTVNEQDVAVTRETIIGFSNPVDLDLIDGGAFNAQFGGQNLSFRGHFSPDNKTVTLFYSDPLPSSARIKVTVNGNSIFDNNGNAIDVDNDGTPGGIVFFEFDTLTLTSSPNTTVVGRVFASELNPDPSGNLSINEPLEGVRITVDGMEDELVAFTDEFGDFRLESAPAGRFFVHIDGRTATANVSAGAYYPFVGKTWESIPGEETEVGNIYLPLVTEGTLQPISETEDTTVTFPTDIVNEFPELAGVSLTVPADSLYSNDGSRGGMVGIAPVAPNRLPGELPEGLEFPLVITVQTNGATNFDQPAPICFPNLPDPVLGVPLAPGEKNALYSFNHDTGKWSSVGTMTVSADGNMICTDPGVGILAPGWHGTGPIGSDPPPPICENPSIDDEICEEIAGKVRVSQFQEAEVSISSFVCKNKDFNPNKLDICIGDCGEDLFLCAGQCSLASGLAIAGGAIAANPVAILLAILGGEGCLLYCELNGIKCIRRCRRDHGQCGGFEQVGIEQKRNLTPTQNRVDVYQNGDDEIEAIHDLTHELIVLLKPYAITGQPFPQDVLDQVQSTISVMNEIGNGDVISFLQEKIIQMEEELYTPENEIFVSPGNAPPYPVKYMAAIMRPSETVQLRGETEAYGQYNLFVPRDGTLLYVSFYDERTKSYGVIRPKLSPNVQFRLPHFWLHEVDDSYPDFDDDGLADVVELVYGTDPGNSDSDGDGINDGAEVEQGTNPLDGKSTKTGIIATANTPGTAVDIDVFNDQAVIADYDRGISVFNVFNGMNPTIIAQINTPGTAVRVACAENTIAVADGPAGLSVIDMSDPSNAHIAHQVRIGGSVTSVAIGGNIAYVGTNDRTIASVDLRQGFIIEKINVAKPVKDLKVVGDHLYALYGDSIDGTLEIYSLNNGSLQSAGSASARRDAQRLFVGDEIAYITNPTGYHTYNITNPEQIRRPGISFTQQFGWQQIVTNGTSVGIAAVGPNSSADGPHHVSLYDVSDPSMTNVFVTQIETPGFARSVSLYNGQAYVADSEFGLQVINYLSYDANGVAPTIEMNANVPLDSSMVERNQVLRIFTLVKDDVQVRNVEFYIDGERMATDGNFPFEFQYQVPSIEGKDSFVLQARASDTGGNFTWTDEVTFTILPDITPPQVIYISPNRNQVLGTVDSVSVVFDERIDPNTVTEDTLITLSAGEDDTASTADDVLITGGVLSHQENVNKITLTFPVGLEPGKYIAFLNNNASDISGNTVDSEISWEFQVASNVDSDEDGVPDDYEAALELDPTLPDTDGNMVSDGQEDFDGDGLSNLGEFIVGTDPADPDTLGDGILDGDYDSDLDELTTGEEVNIGTDPFNPDTDNDSWPDGIEVMTNSDPLDPLDTSRLFSVSRPRINSIVSRYEESTRFNLINGEQTPMTIKISEN